MFREPILRNPFSQNAGTQIIDIVRTLPGHTQNGEEPDGNDGERNQHFNQGKSVQIEEMLPHY